MGIGDATCRSCQSAVAVDQRYCLNCGERVAARVEPAREAESSDGAGSPVLDAPRAGLPLTTGRVAAVLVLAALGTGVLLGGAASPVRSSTAATPGSVIAVMAPTPTPSPAPTPDPALPLGGGGSGSGLPDDVAPPAIKTTDTGTADASGGQAAPAAASSVVAAEPVAEEPVAEEPVAEEPVAEEPAAEEPTPEADAPPAAEGPPAKHVVVISLTGQRFKEAFGPGSPATYLSRELPKEGVLLKRYAPVARGSLANQLVLLAGIAPTPEQEADCSAVGATCRVSAKSPSLPAALAEGGRSWKAYVQNRSEPCRRPVAGEVFGLQRDPFPYLRGIQDECPSADVDLSKVGEDFATSELAPAFAYIVPDFCHDGRDLNCPFEPGTSGLQRADAFLRFVVPAITSSAAFKDDGLLVVLFDGGNLPPRGEGDEPPAVGAVVLGRFARKGKVSARPYDHLSLLRSFAGTFGIAPPGRSADADVKELGRDVFRSSP